MAVYLIRHALTQPTGGRSSVWPLSEEGESQARSLADADFWSAVRTVYSSPEPKALSTIRPAVEKHKLSLVARDCLREVQRPDRWIEDYEAAARQYLEGSPFEQDGWENREHAASRIRDCVERIEREAAGAHVAVCSHGLALTLYLGSLPETDQPVFALWRSIGFAEIAVVENGHLVEGFRPLVTPREQRRQKR